MLFCPHEAKLPTKEDEACSYARFPRTSQDENWQACNTTSNAQGSISTWPLMPAIYRLSRADFTRMRTFKRLPGTCFSFSWGFLDGRINPGGACVISTKTAPRANVRNTVKRRCRAVLLPILKTLKEPIVIVLHAKKGASEASMLELKAEIEKLVRRAGIVIH